MSKHLAMTAHARAAGSVPGSTWDVVGPAITIIITSLHATSSAQDASQQTPTVATPGLSGEEA